MQTTTRWILVLFILNLTLATFAQSGELFGTNTAEETDESETNSSSIVTDDESTENSPSEIPAALIRDGIVYNPSVCYGTATTGMTDECRAMMAAFPSPPVEDIRKDGFTLSAYNFWRVGPQHVDILDAPGGNVIDGIPDGFNFVNVINANDPNWLQIEGGGWIPRDVAELREASTFSGVELLDGLEYPFAFVLDTSGLYSSAYPGGPQDSENGRLMFRYDHVSIFDQIVDEEGWKWYMVGEDQWIKQTFVSAAHKLEEIPEGVSGRWVAVDLFEQNIVGYEDDRPVFATLVSSGVEGSSTNEGLFEIWARLPADGMSGATGAPDAYALQSVPWVMYFDGGISLHGTYWHDIFGYRTSHGCVNLSISDARYVFEWASGDTPNEDGEIDTFVYVYSTDEYR